MNKIKSKYCYSLKAERGKNECLRSVSGNDVQSQTVVNSFQ